MQPLGLLPLKDSPNFSRLNSNLSANTTVNYYMMAFNPGYALQASELNEIVEYNQISQSLYQRMNALWSTPPFWEGAIPLNPDSISISNESYSQGNLSYTVTIPSGWFLWTDSVSKLSHWIYYKATSETYALTGFSTQSTTIGFSVTSGKISCCSGAECAEGSDPYLRDNSQNDAINNFNTCGASRFKLTINPSTPVVIRNNLTTNNSTFAPILTVNIVSTSSLVIETRYLNSRTVIQN